jgi:segregation and condensation protein B
VSEPQDPRSTGEPAVAPHADADPPTEAVDEPRPAEPAVAEPVVPDVAEVDSAGPVELGDADPPSGPVGEVRSVEPAVAEPVVPEAAEVDSAGPVELSDADSPTESSSDRALEELRDADPPSGPVDDARSAERDEPVVADPAEVNSAGPGELTDADPPTEVSGDRALEELRDADPPSGPVGEVRSVEPAVAEPVVLEAAEVDSAGPGELTDADPPTDVSSTPDAAGVDAGPALEEPSDADPPSEPVGETRSAESAVAEPVVPDPAEVDSAGPEELTDADPPTELVDEPPTGENQETAAADAEPQPAADQEADPPLAATASSEVSPAETDVAAETGTAGETDTADEADAADETDEEVESDELPRLDDDELEKALEALLLIVDSPVEEDVLASAVGTELDRVVETLKRMAAHLAEHERGLDLRRAGGGWRFYTRDKYAPYVEKMLLDGQRAKLTRAALETLAVIAYRQPVTRARVAAVRGVNCDGVIRTLLARGLVEETGTDLETGGYLYRTTELFLERLGLSSLDDLPPIAPLLPEVDSIDDI